FVFGLSARSVIRLVVEAQIDRAMVWAFFFSSRRRHTRSVSAFLLNRSSDLISNDGSNKLNRSRKARVSYKVQRTINASLNAATSTRAVSSNPNFVTRQKIEIIFG